MSNCVLLSSSEPAFRAEAASKMDNSRSSESRASPQSLLSLFLTSVLVRRLAEGALWNETALHLLRYDPQSSAKTWRCDCFFRRPPQHLWPSGPRGLLCPIKTMFCFTTQRSANCPPMDRRLLPIFVPWFPPCHVLSPSDNFLQPQPPSSEGKKDSLATFLKRVLSSSCNWSSADEKFAHLDLLSQFDAYHTCPSFLCNLDGGTVTKLKRKLKARICTVRENQLLVKETFFKVKNENPMIQNKQINQPTTKNRRILEDVFFKESGTFQSQKVGFLGGVSLTSSIEKHEYTPVKRFLYVSHCHSPLSHSFPIQIFEIHPKHACSLLCFILIASWFQPSVHKS